MISTPRDEGIEAARRKAPKSANPYRRPGVYNAELDAFAVEWDGGHDAYMDDLAEKRLSSTR
jgi:hypothetical protein